jgi:SAM-dependent methyltransferase
MTDLPGFFEGTGMPDTGWWAALWPDPAAVLVQVGVTEGMDVVDLCCGDGWFTWPIAKLARHATAIDIDANLLERAKRRALDSGAKNCVFAQGDAYDIANLVRTPVDMVFLANAFHGVPDKLRLSKAVSSILKPAGRFVIINWHALPREQTTVLGEARGPATDLRMTPEATGASVTPSGLLLREVVELWPYHYGVVFEKPY